MNKAEFLAELEKGLSGLPRDDVAERLSFYAEMIDDRVEEGASEEDAVAGLGTVDEIVSQIVVDTPFTKIVKETIAPKRSLRGWEIALLILGFPLWFSLLCVAGVLFLALYAVVWALIVVLWAIDVSLAVCALGSLAAAVVYFIGGRTYSGIAAFGAVLILVGLSLFLFFGCLAASKGSLKLTKKISLLIKRSIIRKDSTK